jgi:hypothetical protein
MGRTNTLGNPPRPHWKGSSYSDVSFNFRVEPGPASFSVELQLFHVEQFVGTEQTASSPLPLNLSLSDRSGRLTKIWQLFHVEQFRKSPARPFPWFLR